MNNKVLIEFDNYVKKFDLKNEKIFYKYKHSYRVYEYAKDIANSLKLSKEEITLAMTCGILHDIGRFSQIDEFDTYIDSKSVDHGNRGYEVLLENNYINKYVDDENDKNLVLYTVKNHNKFTPEETNNEREKMFLNIIRDADKIDIMLTQGLSILDDGKINRKCVDDLKNNKLVNNNSVVSDSDMILRLLSFVLDINYKRSFEIILENNIIEDKIALLKEKLGDDEELSLIENNLLDYIKERLEC